MPGMSDQNLVIPPLLRGDKRIFIPVGNLPASSRLSNCLKDANFSNLGQAAGLHPESPGHFKELHINNFGAKMRQELREILQGIGLDFGMYQIPANWVPQLPDVKDIYKTYSQHKMSFDSYMGQRQMRAQEIRTRIEKEMHEAFQVAPDAEIPSYEAMRRATKDIASLIQEYISGGGFRKNEGGLICEFFVSGTLANIICENPALKSELENVLQITIQQAAAKILLEHPEP
jgi:hypothetical protein